MSERRNVEGERLPGPRPGADNDSPARAPVEVEKEPPRGLELELGKAERRGLTVAKKRPESLLLERREPDFGAESFEDLRWVKPLLCTTLS